MTKVFVDTAGWLALVNKDDQFHNKAQAIRDQLLSSPVSFITTEWVLLEVANGLSKRRFRKAAVRLLEAIYRSPNIRVVRIDPYLWDKAWNLFKKSRDKDWSLTDCMSFVVMRDEGIRQAFTTDRHFEQAGFLKLLS
uniref:Ribonuclease VapC n=2 Tax=Candidatus Bipolaricaulota TaxID=67810 RepID=H5SP50_9BACT|nr:PilT domain-containing protein [uncultured Acetothermia bacterium]BAL58550.1 PilT domain-containing protein [Candidatus Acetothermum autotrophicum]